MDSLGRGLQALSNVPSGVTVTVRGLLGNPDADRLHELGLGAGKRVRILADGDPLLCQVEGSRIGLQRRLARCILVDLIP